MKKYIIAQNGQSAYWIVTSQFAENAELYAASQLQKYLYESLNTYVPYFSDRCIRRGKEIFIGKSARDIGANIDFSSLGEEGYLIQTIGDDILIAGNTGRGTLYGVYAFLEKFLKYRMFTNDVEKIEHKQELILSEMEIRETPAFEYRDCYSRFAWDIEFSVKNKLNGSAAPIPNEMGGKVKFYNCHHSFFDLVPPKYYKETHPEYYSVAEGDGNGKQLCLSNENVFEIARAQLVRWIKENPECRVFSIAQNDYDSYCQCPKCKAIDEYHKSPSGSVIRFVNRLAESIEKEYPQVLLHTFAYRYSKVAPKNLKVKDNVIVRLCNIECGRAIAFEDAADMASTEKGAKEARDFLQNITDWMTICKRLYVWDYVLNFRHYLMPMLPLGVFAKNLQMYKKFNIQGVLMEGNFSYGGDASMGDLKNYVLAKLLWDPNENVDCLKKEFIYGVYGKGAPYIEKYVDLMEKSITGKYADIYDTTDREYYSEETIKQADALFELAEKADTNPTIIRRIQRERLAIEYMKTVRIEDNDKRCEAADALYEKLKEHKITEIAERTDLRDAIRWIKENQYASATRNWYSMYYIVK